MTTPTDLSTENRAAPAAAPDLSGNRSGALCAESFVFFEKLVRERIGIQLSGKGQLVESHLHRLVRTHNLSDVDELMTRIQAGDRRLTAEALEAMTNNETSFFRDCHPFEALAGEILPELFRSKPLGKVHVWNAACSSGQESYSLAITLHEHLPQQANPARVEILSTDVSQPMVDRTAAGSYSRFEVNRGLPATLGQKYFHQQGRNWVAKPMIRDLITTRRQNLLEAWVGIPRCDLVLLRNVLIYFSPDLTREILRRLRVEVLNRGGYLMLGASESLIGLDDNYVARRINQSTVYQVGGTRS